MKACFLFVEIVQRIIIIIIIIIIILIHSRDVVAILISVKESMQ